MRDLILQFHPQRAPKLAITKVLERMALVAGSIPELKAMTIMRGRDRGPYIDVSFTVAAKYLPKLWSLLSRRTRGRNAFGRSLSAASMVYCEGSRGWDNYKLLHHFDSRQMLDSMLPSNKSLSGRVRDKAPSSYIGAT